MKPGLIKSSNELPIARDSELGWIVSGGKSLGESVEANVIALMSNIELENKISRFLQNECFDVENRDALTEEEGMCENHYKNTHIRDSNGRFIVTIPFKNGMSSPILGHSRHIAMTALFQLEKRFERNSKMLLKKIPMGDRETQSHMGFIKALGVVWSPSLDEFTFNLNSISVDTIPKTKRQLYSEITSIHDPIGWITPVVIMAKHMMQLVWKEGIDWDDQVPEKYTKMWCKFKGELKLLNEIKIPRSINYSPSDIMELHGFSDASEVGYSAAIYIKNVTQNTMRLLTSKARVIPKKEEKNDKNVTIPRLELSGALLLAELIIIVKESLQIDFQNIYLWTDSQIVLDWSNANPKRYKVFIATRIERINKLVNKKHWNHVGTKSNAADCASRRMSPSELLNHHMWFNDPDFLYEKIMVSKVSNNEDRKVSAHISAFFATNDNSKVMSLLPNNCNIMSFGKLKRVIAYCFRFAYKKKNESKQLTLDELYTKGRKCNHLRNST